MLWMLQVVCGKQTMSKFKLSVWYHRFISKQLTPQTDCYILEGRSEKQVQKLSVLITVKWLRMSELVFIVAILSSVKVWRYSTSADISCEECGAYMRLWCAHQCCKIMICTFCDILSEVIKPCVSCMIPKLKSIPSYGSCLKYVRFQVLTTASMKFIFVFWDILPCKIIVD
jgi:hypothetical protein